jgi:hypothetical protein
MKKPIVIRDVYFIGKPKWFKELMNLQIRQKKKNENK